MKKLLISVIAVAGIWLAAGAQKIDVSKVPSAVKTSFDSKYPATTAEWRKEGEKYKADFKYMGSEMCTMYNANGNLEETKTAIKTDELPASITNYVNEHHKQERIKKAMKITKANGETNYRVEVDNKNLIFDASGKPSRGGRK